MLEAQWTRNVLLMNTTLDTRWGDYRAVTELLLSNSTEPVAAQQSPRELADNIIIN